MTEHPRETYDSVFRLRTADGEYRWIRSVGKGIFDESGTLVRCAGVHIDIHRAQEAQLELRNSEERYRTLFEESPQMHANVDVQTGRIIDCNQLAIQRLGFFEKSEVVGLHIREVYDPSCHDALEEAFARFASTGKVDNCELTLRTKYGSTIPIILNVAAVRDATGKIHYSSATWSDVSDLKKYTKQLERANEELERFTYVASHDLRSPLRAIDHLTTWLTEDLGDDIPEESAKHLAQLRQRVTRMERLLDDLLSFSRAGRIRGAVSEIDLAEMIDGLDGVLNLGKGFTLSAHLKVDRITGFHSPLETVVPQFGRQRLQTS